jgi:hypothetical protein
MLLFDVIIVGLNDRIFFLREALDLIT